MNNKINFFLAAAVVTAVSAYLFIFPPGHGSIFYPPCIFNFLTGFYCPGCGSARASHAIVHGDLLKAADYNLLFVLFIPYFIYSFVSYGVFTFTGRQLPQLLKGALAINIIIAVIMIYWIIRNIPWGPLRWLAP